MDYVEIITNLIIGIVVLFMAGGMIWNAAKVFGLKGFFISTGIFLSLFIIPISFEKFIEYSYENKPILIIIFFAIISLFLIWIVINTIVVNLKAGGETKRQFIKALIKDIKILGLSLLGGIAFVGIIILSIM